MAELTVVQGESGPRGRELCNTVYVMPEHHWAPIVLMVDQYGTGTSRHALAPLSRLQALRVAWGLAKAIFTARQRDADDLGGGQDGE